MERGNPRSSIIGYLNAASEFNWEKAAEYLDLLDLPPDILEVGGPELARQFNHVVSRSVWLDRLRVSDSPQGLQGDDLPAYRDELMRIPGEDGETPIWIQKVPRADGVLIWKLSNRSVARIPELYTLYNYSAPIEKFRGGFQNRYAIPVPRVKSDALLLRPSAPFKSICRSLDSSQVIPKLRSWAGPWTDNPAPRLFAAKLITSCTDTKEEISLRMQ